jgi:hypothetical protein
VADANYFGICYQVEKDGNIFPAADTGNGDYIIISPDDLPTMVVYHRILGESSSNDTSSGFGKNTLITQSYQVKMVVFCSLRKLREASTETEFNLKDDILSYIPIQLLQNQLEYLNSQSLVISISSIDNNKRNVFTEEFPNTEFMVGAEHALLSISYSIELKYQSSCREAFLC